MELQINKNSFLDEFIKIKNIENRPQKEKTEGFQYLHNMTTKRMAEGEEFKIGNLDFSKFAYDDLTDYMEYFEKVLQPRISKAHQLFEALRQAGSVFSPDKRYY